MQVKSQRRVDEDEASDWLNRQSEFYKHNQRQAFRLIQLVIGAGALIVALLSDSFGPIVNALGSGGSALLHKNVTAELLTASLEIGQVIGHLFILICLLFIVDSVQWALKVMRTKKPRPAVGKSDRVRPIDIKVGEFEPHETPDGQTIKQSQLSDWLNHNHELLSEMDSHLGNSYTKLAWGGAALVAGLIFIFGSTAGAESSILLSTLILALAGLKSVIQIASVIPRAIKLAWHNSDETELLPKLYDVYRQIVEPNTVSRPLGLLYYLAISGIVVLSIFTIAGVAMAFFLPNSAY